jgi:Mg2+ and Co2+ transporter CorA
VKATIFDGTSLTAYDPSDIAAFDPMTPYVWIDVIADSGQDPEVLTFMKAMGFTDVVAAYTTRSHSSGMFQAFGSNMLGSTYAAADDAGPPVLIHCAWNSGCIVTIRRGADKAVAQAREDLTPRASTLFAQPGSMPGILLQLILDSIDRQLTSMMTAIDLLDGQIIITTKPGQLATLQQMRTPIEDLGTTIPSYLENVNESLVAPESLPGVDADGVHALQAYAACVNDVVQRIDSAGSDIRSAIQDYQGQVSAVQGNRINQLTLVSIIFLPITFMTGYFGQNFQFLTDATWSFGAWFVLGVILPVTITVVSIVLLQRSGFHIGKTMHFRTRGKSSAKT